MAPVSPVAAAAPCVADGGYAFILVLFILLVIIARPWW
ncbi:YjcZ family sporulation protein [Ammoniphilus sp. CFH 90114]|nr:YjcZ family sporulation protein [Ammoniphilus sp. CFH 90114]